MLGSWLRALIVACALGVVLSGHPEVQARGTQAGASKAEPAAKRKTAVRPATGRSAASGRTAARSTSASGKATGAKVLTRRARTATPRRAVATRSTARKAAKPARTTARAQAQRASIVAVPSLGEAIGLRQAEDPLRLGSSVALVVDARSGAVLYEKNPDAVLPIASISKLLTAMVVLDSRAPMSEMLTITAEDIDTERHSSSRLAVGTTLSRGEMLHLALMASENRAANALGRHHPGGLATFVAAMNRKAQAIGMRDSSFVEPTGLSAANVANAHDLVRLVREAARYPLLRSYSTTPGMTVDTGYRQVSYHNTNRLVKAGWEIGIQKTGYISEAGRCLVMQTLVDGRPVVMVLLDSAGSNTRFGDARRLRDWLEAGGMTRTSSPSASASPQARAAG